MNTDAEVRFTLANNEYRLRLLPVSGQLLLEARGLHPYRWNSVDLLEAGLLTRIRRVLGQHRFFFRLANWTEPTHEGATHEWLLRRADWPVIARVLEGLKRGSLARGDLRRGLPDGYELHPVTQAALELLAELIPIAERALWASEVPPEERRRPSVVRSRR